MARITSPITFKGNLGNTNGYTRAGSSGASFIRMIPGASRETFLTRASMELTRQNAQEFAGISQTAGALNDYVPRWLRKVGGRTYYDLIKLVSRQMIAENSGIRGKRDILFTTTNWINLFLGSTFSGTHFNNRIFSNMLFSSPTRQTPQVDFYDGILPGDISAPVDATHMQIVCASYVISSREYDPNIKKYILISTPDSELYSDKSPMIDITATTGAFVLSPVVVQVPTAQQAVHTFVYVFFYQYSGTDYLFKGGASDTVVGVNTF